MEMLEMVTRFMNVSLSEAFSPLRKTLLTREMEFLY